MIDETQEIYDLIDGTSVKRRVDSCDWHQAKGIEYLTSGKCEGPACSEYFLAHVDDRDDDGGDSGW